MIRLDRRELIVGGAAATLVSCSETRESPVVGPKEAFRMIEAATARAAKEHPRPKIASTFELENRPAGSTPNKLNYDSAAAQRYRQQWCNSTNDCPSGSYLLDCTHFACHALAAGGVYIKKPSAPCGHAQKLGIRADDLAMSFQNSTGLYTNVIPIRSHRDTKKGDFCFIPEAFFTPVEHVMVLEETATPTGARVWAHTSSRCGTLATFNGLSCIYYRIEP